ncbi:MAG: dihydroorotase [Steroidobacteraceae bacterium]|nr:dihydroorotase [Nevskiaceae bacterium]MCP5339008.1 dihydroorotase [Nevskiaceae bacterium]MCP5359580.1 dihydroorotase [Nevskiaceae bacterium]MCP5472627.1 dihydroorotase [Nevskiaceae bacterium]
MSPDTITLGRPDDWHLHLRDGAALRAVLPHTAERFARAIVMPNLKPPVTTTALAADYRRRILEARPTGSDFEPLMTLYLTDQTSPAEIDRACDSGFIHGCKLYPAGATTHSDSGVTDLARIEPVLARMAERGMVLQVHGEVTRDAVDVFDREARFIDELLAPLAARQPRLRIVFEHVTSRAAVEFVRGSRDGIAATLTPQHLLHNRNALFVGGLRPHFYCLPVLKTESDRAALLEAATSGDPRFFLGTDSAPHARHLKEHACGCAGMYSAHAALELYAEAFDSVGALDRLDGFAHRFGADFYGLPRNAGTVTLHRIRQDVPTSFHFGDGELVPMRAGERLAWTLQPKSATATAMRR